jgi:hypothetical protein
MAKPHDDGARRQARQVYEARGAKAASQITGIPVRTIQQWAQAEGWPRTLTVAQDTTKSAEDRRQAAVVGWHTRRQHMADQLGHVGAQLLEAIQRDLAQRQRLNLRDAGILLGIMLDKAELLSERTGWAGDEDVSAEQSIADINRVLDAIESQAAGDG